MTDNKKVTISERALFQRMKRHLEKEENLVLRKCRPGPYYAQLGEYYTVDIGSNVIIKRGMDIEHLEDYARRLHVISKNEKIEK